MLGPPAHTLLLHDAVLAQEATLKKSPNDAERLKALSHAHQDLLLRNSVYRDPPPLLVISTRFAFRPGLARDQDVDGPCSDLTRRLRPVDQGGLCGIQ